MLLASATVVRTLYDDYYYYYDYYYNYYYENALRMHYHCTNISFPIYSNQCGSLNRPPPNYYYYYY